MEVYGLLASGGIYDWPVIKQISWILGQVMNGIYNVMSAIGIENIGVSIIIFTIIVYTILLPLTIKQQKFSKMTAVMNPEIQKIQKKYAGKKAQLPGHSFSLWNVSHPRRDHLPAHFSASYLQSGS